MPLKPVERRPAVVAAPPPATKKPPSPVIPRLIPLIALDVSKECKWPCEGDKERTKFCGHPQFNGGPYCEYHDRLAYAGHR